MSVRITQISGFLLAVLLALLVSCAPPRDKVEPPRTAIAQRQSLRIKVDELGAVESTRTVNVNSPFNGRIVSIIDSGTAVNEGDVIAVLDTKALFDTLKDQIERLKGTKKDIESSIESLQMEKRANILDVSSSEAQLDLARVELEDVNRNLSELEVLYERQISTQEEVRSATSDKRISEIGTLSRDRDFRGQLTGQQSAELSNKTTIERHALSGDQTLRRIRETQEKLGLAEIKSPATGIFLRESRWNWQLNRNVEKQPGEEVNGGEQIGRVPDTTSLVIRSQVPESELQRIRTGLRAELVFEALGGLALPGVISFVSPVAIERERSAGASAGGSSAGTTGEKVFEVLVEPKSTDARVRPGLTARVRIILEEMEGTVTVPVEAIRRSGESHAVMVSEGKDTRVQEVTVGRTDGTSVQVLSGLREGETVFLDDV